MRSKFTEISTVENGELNISEKIHTAGMGRRAFQTIYHLVLNYKGEQFTIKNLIGAQSYGEITMELNDVNEGVDFNIETKSPFLSLFSFNKERLNITCKNEQLKMFLNTNRSIKKLLEIIEETQFEPSITGKAVDGKYILKTVYHLQFPERTVVIEPLIGFYKSIIDHVCINHSINSFV